MAKTNDIEGVGGAGSFSVRSGRCFRDYSPSDTTISLSNDGQTYSCPVPTFPDRPGLQTQSRSLEHYEDARPSTIPSILSHEALTTQQNSSSCLADRISPLARFRHDAQSHEQLALGISLAKSGQHPTFMIPRPLPLVCAQTEGNSRCEPSEISSLCLSPSPIAGPTSAKGSETSSAAELRELLDVIESPGWKNDVPLEEQVQYLLRATMLKRRVRSETYPREVKTTKVRKRSRSHKHAGVVRHSSSH
ncbi:hypothetical protein F4818DRAFT_184623 [Hypoxylon cercidicola]|nr:hypothetical protein F4818DRAFT_184623 [Hypoxylon cercidicola]